MENWHEMLWTRAIWFIQYHTFRYIWHYLEIEWFPFGACCGCRPDDSGSTRASFCKRRHFGYKCGGPDRYISIISGRNDTQTADFFTPEFTNRIHPNKKGAKKSKKKHVGYMVYSWHRRAKNIGPRVFFAPASSFSKAAISVVISIPEPRHLKKRNLRDLERDVIIFHWLNWFPWFLERRWCGVIMNHSSNIQCMKRDKKRDQPKTIILIDANLINGVYFKF